MGTTFSSGGKNLQKGIIPSHDSLLHMNGTGDMPQETDVSGLPHPPPPPPPPPFPHVSCSRISKSTKLFNCTVQDETSSFEDAIKKVADAERSFHPKPFYSINTHLKSQLQEGPKCGLVALSIATSMTCNFKSANELFDEAVGKGFTTQGEMYSTENVASLVESSTEFKTFVLDCGINSHIDCIFNCIQNGGLMLVPYDADYNHSPCCRKGHSAHWAVMSGMVIFLLKDSEEDDCLSGEENASIMINPELYPICQCLKTDDKKFFNARSDEIKILRRASDIYFIKNGNDLKNVRRCKLYLAGKQGKSKYLALWPFERLAESNNNLTELSEQQKGLLLMTGYNFGFMVGILIITHTGNNTLLELEPLSPILYAIFIAYMEEVMKNGQASGVVIGNQKIWTLTYADDAVLLANDEKEVVEITRRFETYINERDFEVKVDKTNDF